MVVQITALWPWISFSKWRGRGDKRKRRRRGGGGLLPITEHFSEDDQPSLTFHFPCKLSARQRETQGQKIKTLLTPCQICPHWDDWTCFLKNFHSKLCKRCRATLLPAFFILQLSLLLVFIVLPQNSHASAATPGCVLPMEKFSESAVLNPFDPDVNILTFWLLTWCDAITSIAASRRQNNCVS